MGFSTSVLALHGCNKDFKIFLRFSYQCNLLSRCCFLPPHIFSLCCKSLMSSMRSTSRFLVHGVLDMLCEIFSIWNLSSSFVFLASSGLVWLLSLLLLFSSSYLLLSWLITIVLVVLILLIIILFVSFAVVYVSFIIITITVISVRLVAVITLSIVNHLATEGNGMTLSCGQWMELWTDGWVKMILASPIMSCLSLFPNIFLPFLLFIYFFVFSTSFWR